MGLHKRVKRYNVLPDPGGLLDQDEKTMKMLDKIQDIIDKREKIKADVEAAKAGRG